MTLVIADPREALENLSILGGKGGNLARLEALGMPVPPWYAVTTLASSLMSAELEQEVKRAHAIRIGEDAYVAVRSSAAGEDAAGESFAGLHDSFLYVKGWGQLFD